MPQRPLHPTFEIYPLGHAQVTTHFSVEELTRGQGWLSPEESYSRYRGLAVCSLEVLRLILGRMDVNSGERSPERNAKGGRPSSHHLRPEDRASLRERQLPYLRGGLADWPELMGAHSAACDFGAHDHPEDVAWHVIDICQREGIIPPGGAFWYAGRPGGRFVHVDNRGVLARERKLTPDGAARPKARSLIYAALRDAGALPGWST